ncbi:hypothetical protein DTO166G4_1669 [Paecilomyces variotii]|nr:hypothetical protein DTO166G4_1669 [Paecilomyces variotii]KAJ9237993.1 hypothetical protein DTO166G5_3230 [Paecilomyces variotii]KAJ9370542.1 hypothetical protein DTO282E5_4710 [Paecilomyces variotii]
MPRTLQRRETGVRKRAVSANGDYQEDQEFLRPHDDLPSSPLSFRCLGGLKLVSGQIMKRFFSHQASSVPAQQLRLNGK